MIIFLIGFMGSGKSYYAEKIASMLKIPYIDLDAAIEQNQEMSIAELFARKGEAEFRRLEALTLKEQFALLAANSTASAPSSKGSDPLGLIACGGGTPCFHDNMKWMNERGLTIWINPSTAVIKARLKNERATRPLIAGLSDDELDEFVEAKLQSREKYYSQANIQITDPEMPIEQIIKKIHHA